MQVDQAESMFTPPTGMLSASYGKYERGSFKVNYISFVDLAHRR